MKPLSKLIVLATLVLLTSPVLAAPDLGGSEGPGLQPKLIHGQPFVLNRSYPSNWGADQESVSAGFLMVFEVDEEVLAPRQGYAPMLFVGTTVVELVNTGQGSGRWIGIVASDPTPSVGALEGAKSFVSEIQVLPEALTAVEAMRELAQAEGEGALGFTIEDLGVVSSRPVRLASRYELYLRAADLIERFSPTERDLIDGLRAPLVRKLGGRRATSQRREVISPTVDEGGVEIPFGASEVTSKELAGNSLGGFPFFEFVRTFNEGATLRMAIDPGQNPGLVGQSGDAYVVEAKTPAEWQTDPSLTDVSGGAEAISIVGGTVQSNTFVLDTGSLSGDGGLALGVGYDIVLDLDSDGDLGPGDVIDGFSTTPGLYVVPDLTQPGPLPVSEITYSGGSFLGQNTFFPSAIDQLGELPLIIVSHGNGHNYQWYNHIGNHMASWGYVVMSHQNNTGPGIETASTTTLTNTDFFLGNLNSIDGGTLDGHIDSSRITWIGHSRGGEGITRAYDRIFDGVWSPVEYSLEDLKLLSSIAPTDFLLVGGGADPHGANYHLWVGGADADVSGCAGSNVTQSFHLLDRALGSRQSISLHGVGHGDFHDGGGSSVASGPCLVGRSSTHDIMRGHLLPLVKFYIENDLAGEDFLWRQWERFRPIGAPTGSCIVADLYYRARGAERVQVLDDFQTETSTGTSSSGGAVSFTVTELTEGRLDDGTSSFTNSASDPMNGMTLASASDTSRGLVFEYQGSEKTLEFEVPLGMRNLTGFKYLSFRGAQATRHPNTTGESGDQQFSVVLRDGDGEEALLSIGAYGGGLEEPYQRTGCGSGTGWNNEFETVRLGLNDFLNNGSSLNLADVEAVVFRFGSAQGSSAGRIGLDEVEFVGGTSSIFVDGFESGDTGAWSSTVQ